MDNQKFGKFIKEQRQNLGLTQKDLGEKLNVTDKAVSKWERGLSFPDITIIKPLAEIFGISTSELLNSEIGKKEEINVEQAVKDAIEQYKNLKEKRRKKLKKLRIIFGILSGLTFIFACIIQTAYIFVFKPRNYEYVMDVILYIINEIIIVSGFLSTILLLKNGRIKNIIASTLLVLTTIINVIFMNNNVQKRECIVSFSRNMRNELVLKIDKDSGKINYFRDSKFILWAKKHNSLEYGARGEVHYQWIEDDICAIIYKDKDKFLRAFVATYGIRAENQYMSYYHVTATILGDWQSENNNKIFVQDGKIRIKIDGISEIFDTSECKQFGDSAIVLYKGSVPMYVIGLNKNCIVDRVNDIVKDGGTITLLRILDKASVPEEFVCVTYKNNNNLENYNKIHVDKNGYKIKDKKLYISYDGENAIEVPGIYEDRNFAEEEYQIAEYKTFFYYNYNEKRFFVYSDDMGKTWNQEEIEVKPSIKSIKFPSSKVGYMLVFDDVASGTAWGRLLKTEDGGKTWIPVFYGFGNEPEKIFGRGSQINFVDEKVGFITLLKANKNDCNLYITKDGAKTFEQVKIPIDTSAPENDDSKYDFYNLPYKDTDKVWRFNVSQGEDADEGAKTRIYEFDENFDVRRYKF
ncbi:MAG: helix-turn-helix domain-containing protein [Clostridia bacterium]|nr:helix-turn-helix domain-containing protein [Clostridia bacterium]